MTKATFVNFFYRSYQVLLTCYYTQVSYTGSWEPLVCISDFAIATNFLIIFLSLFCISDFAIATNFLVILVETIQMSGILLQILFYERGAVVVVILW